MGNEFNLSLGNNYRITQLFTDFSNLSPFAEKQKCRLIEVRETSSGIVVEKRAYRTEKEIDAQTKKHLDNLVASEAYEISETEISQESYRELTAQDGGNHIIYRLTTVPSLPN